MSRTTSLVNTLIQNDQDFEWYPTTNEMIGAVARWLPEDAKSIMDIGAGDGRVLLALSKKCTKALLYGIEVSTILIQEQPECVIPVGTNLFEQNLSTLQVEYIFCNPKYSQYEQWVMKIVGEGFAKKAFLVIPKRWQQSDAINESLKARGATARVLFSGDFLQGDRRARAEIDIVEVSFPRDKWGNGVKDPFEIWFDANIDIFDREKELEPNPSRDELARRYSHSSIDEIAAEYQEEYARLEENYQAIFKMDYAILKELGMDKNKIREGLKLKIAGLKTKYWQILFDQTDAITSRLTTVSKKKLLDKLAQNMSVEFTVSNAYSIILWAIKNANQYFDEQLIVLFKGMTEPENIKTYKSNKKTFGEGEWRYARYEWRQIATHFMLDYRIVLPGHGGIGVNDWDSYYTNKLRHSAHEFICDVVAVMSNLGFSTFSQSSWERMWKAGEWQDFTLNDGDTVLFQAKAHLNGNLHFRFAPEAIMALNIQAARVLKWVKSESEVVIEMGVSPKEARKYFNYSPRIGVKSVPMLAMMEE